MSVPPEDVKPPDRTLPDLSQNKRKWPSFVLDVALIVILVALLIRPLFQLEYVDQWGSIESTFIADARFLRDHWVHPNWQPNWYCGTRTDYVYPPALRYGTATLAKVTGALPARAYHLYIGILYLLGFAGIYLLARICSGSRWCGWLAAAASALISPSFLLVPRIRDDTPYDMPYRLYVLMFYGEGPHVSAVAILGIALLLSFHALVQYRAWTLVAAALACAGVVSHNFYGATALAVFFIVLTISIYITRRDPWTLVRAVSIAALSYGFTAFWLVPSYLQITLRNMQFVSSGGNMWSVWAGLGALIAFALVADARARGKASEAYFVFLCGSLTAFVVLVIGHEYLNLRIIGEPSRLYPELDLVIILFGCEVARRLWIVEGRAAKARRIAITAVVLVSLSTSREYLTNAFAIFRSDPRPFERVEYRIQDWMARNMPGARAMTAGSVRFWYNVWNDLPQIGGGSEQGLINSRTVNAEWEFLLGEDPDLSVAWMQILGGDVFLVNDRRSQEHYQAIVFPQKFAGKLQIMHDDNAGNTIYRVPRRYAGLARVVDRKAFEALPRIPGNGDRASLAAWSAVVENGPDVAVTTQWKTTDELHVRAPIRDGQSLFVQVSYDSNWRAYSGDTPLQIHNTDPGLMLIDVPPGDHVVRLVFSTPFANQLGRALTLISTVIAGVLIYRDRLRRKALP